MPLFFLHLSGSTDAAIKERLVQYRTACKAHTSSRGNLQRVLSVARTLAPSLHVTISTSWCLLLSLQSLWTFRQINLFEAINMHSSLVRVQNVFGFFTTVAFTIASLTALSVLFFPHNPSASIAIRNIQV